MDQLDLSYLKSAKRTLQEIQNLCDNYLSTPTNIPRNILFEIKNKVDYAKNKISYFIQKYGNDLIMV